MTIKPRERSPLCTHEMCVPGTIECADCIVHNGETDYQRQQWINPIVMEQAKERARLAKKGPDE